MLRFLLIILFFVPNMTYAMELKPNNEQQFAIFAGGCFWCIEADFEKLEGVTEVISGYSGGNIVNPTYQQISTGTTGHAEVILVAYNPNIISYGQLLKKFWTSIDPTVLNRQFCDVGSQYRTAIYYLDQQQKKLAEKSLQNLINSGKLGDQKVYTEITQASVFYKAEDYHQNYYKTNPLRYSLYRRSCGRDQRLKQLWD